MKLASFLAQLTSLGDPSIIGFYLCACWPGRRGPLSEWAWSRGKLPHKHDAQGEGPVGGEGALLPKDRQNRDKQMGPSST